MKFTKTVKILGIIFLTFCVVAAQDDDLSLEEEDENQDEPRLESRVIGGRPTNLYPHIVSLQRNKQHYCAGSIINPSWIVTSAFCKMGGVEALAGQKNIRARDSRLAQRRKISLFIGHEDYDSNAEQSADDIALAKVDTPFTFNNIRLVSIVDLPVETTYPTGNAYVAGWGQYSTRNNRDSPILRHAMVPIHSVATCGILWSNSNYTLTNVCAGHLSGIGSVCTTDAGGPLMAIRTQRPLSFTLVGTVSWTQAQCGQSGKPGVYTLVSYYLDWIKTKIQENSA
uniref:CSON012007 protein n=1 Tax=Culicoides sonorensis TaxID=179676 RepID=A0A336K7E6_CULSO